MTHTIRIESGGQFEVGDDEGSLLRGALRAGVGFPHECNVGGCGACRFELVDGEIDTLWPQAPGLGERDRKRGKHLACQSLPLGDCTIRLRCDESYRPRIAPARQKSALVGRRMLTPDMAELTFKTERAADFLPGQYALLSLPGVAGVRAYSMSNLPNPDGIWQFIVRRTPGGSASHALVDTLPVGSSIDLDAPYGGAWLRTEVSRPIVCVAGGSGLAPMLAIARAAVLDPAASVDFFYGGRTPADLCVEGLIADLPGVGERLRLHNVLSAAAAGEWQGAHGFVHEELERRLGESLPEREFYFAGPPPMIDAVQQLLMHTHRVDFSRIHFDRFV